MLKVVELFCGIGGCAAAVGRHAEIVAAVDINTSALDVYRHNYTNPTITRSIESMRADQLSDVAADLWWLSPPCQPYTRQGRCCDFLDFPATLVSRIPFAIVAPGRCWGIVWQCPSCSGC